MSLRRVFPSSGKNFYFYTGVLMETVNAQNAPKAIGPYSHAVKANGLLFCSGQIPLNPETMTLQQDTIEEATERCILNLKAVLEEGGSSLTQVIKTTIYITDMNDFPKVNEVYAHHFGETKPARATVAVKALPAGAIVEIDAVAEL